MNPRIFREDPKLKELYRLIHDRDLTENNVDMVTEDIDIFSIVDQRSSTQNLIEDKVRLLKISFGIPYITVNGLKIEYLKFQRTHLQYQSFPCVKYKIASDPEYTHMVY